MYLRRHGEHVRSSILAGPDLSFRYGSAAVALTSERALDRLASRCRSDASCGERHPDLRAEVDTVLDRLKGDPAAVRVPSPAGDTIHMQIGRQDFAEGLRYLTYGADACMRRIVTGFLQNPEPAALDASCVRGGGNLDFPHDGR